MVRTAHQKGSGYSFSLQLIQIHIPRPPTPQMSFAVSPVSDCVSTPFALRPQHGTLGPPYLRFV